MTVVLGVPLILVNLLSLTKGSGAEGMETQKQTADKQGTNKPAQNTTKTTNPAPTTDKPEIVSSNVRDEKSGFETGRPKNGGSKIDYATTIEDAYDQLNSILGREGITNLTNDTQKLMKQQMDLAKSMEAMTPLIKGIMPMAEKAQEMMKSMDGNGGLGGVMEMAKKFSSGLTQK